MGAEFDFVLDCMDHFMALDQEFGNFCFVGFLLVSVVVIQRRLAFRFRLSCELVVDPESLTGSKKIKVRVFIPYFSAIPIEGLKDCEKQQKMTPKSWNSRIWQIKFILSVPIYCVWSRKVFLMKILSHYFTFRCIHFCGTCSSFTCTHSTTDVTHILSSFQLKFYAQILHQCIVSLLPYEQSQQTRGTPFLP